MPLMPQQICQVGHFLTSARPRIGYRLGALAVVFSAALAVGLVGLPASALGTVRAHGVSKCTVEKPLTLQQARVLVGLKKRNARLLATENYGWGFRVGERNGEGLAVTTDYQPCRVTVAVKKGRVTKILQVG